MRQRHGVAADEPANGLDPAGIRDMRALVKRPAGSGLTALLSSHDMGEVEQICDDVTIMNTGSVVYHGSITTLRKKAPQQAHEITTTDDDRAAVRAASRRLQVTRTDAGLAVRGPQDEIDALVADLVADGIALRGLSRHETPLQALFFMLTEATPDTPTRDLLTAGAPR